MAGLDRRALIGAIVQKLNVRLDEDDPAFVLVELNRLALEEAAASLVDRVSVVPEQIEAAAAQLLAGCREQVAHQTAQGVAEATMRIGDEVERSRATAAKLIQEVAAANRNVNAAKWFGLAAAAGVALASVAGAGGYFLARSQAQQAAAMAQALHATPEGEAALRLAELGQARMLLDCSGIGWTKKDGFCYGTARDGRTVGWRTQ